MAASGPFSGADPEALVRQAWSLWAPFLGAPAAQAGAADGPGSWRQVLDAWRSLSGEVQGEDALGRLGAAAEGWLGQMQQVLGQFAGREATPEALAEAWRRTLGDNPFMAVLQPPGEGVQALQEWVRRLMPMLAALQPAAPGVAVGVSREHQVRWQRLMQAQSELQQRAAAYAALMAEAADAAFDYFRKALETQAASGQALDSARAVFDVWIEAAEKAYAEVAGGEDFARVCGELVDAQMRLRAGVQAEVDLACRALGMPSRSEVDGAYRKLAEAGRELRRLRARVEALEAALGQARGDGGPAAAAARAGARPAAEKAPKKAAKKAAKKTAATSARASKAQDRRAGAAKSATPASSRRRRPPRTAR
ncbi:poly(R)-hydroxyalkanoic acid synthase subunit PhaE [Coralloluteibacterium thermophilus]|uniref:Poly(3-hydroxyalkanoate) polymerase subunit PhaE n=1 Tax=Coralloluteibacterium thermophilum TaxID=2707049 RepID=A0ABV9NGA2_9GAMM